MSDEPTTEEAATVLLRAYNRQFRKAHIEGRLDEFLKISVGDWLDDTAGDERASRGGTTKIISRLVHPGSDEHTWLSRDTEGMRAALRQKISRTEKSGFFEVSLARHESLPVLRLALAALNAGLTEDTPPLTASPDQP